MNNSRAPSFWLRRISGKLDGLVRRGGVRECDYAGLSKADPVYWLRKIFDRLGYVETVELLRAASEEEIEALSSNDELRILSVDQLAQLLGMRAPREDTFRLVPRGEPVQDYLEQEFPLKIFVGQRRRITEVRVGHWDVQTVSGVTARVTFHLSRFDQPLGMFISSNWTSVWRPEDPIVMEPGDQLNVSLSGVTAEVDCLDGIDLSIVHE